MYKDKAKQREANRQASKRYRHGGPGRAKGMTQGMTNEGIVIPDHPVPVIPKRGKFIDDQGNAHVPDQDFTKLMAQAGPGHVRVSKPGDADYEPQCETTRAFVDNSTGVR